MSVLPTFPTSAVSFLDGMNSDTYDPDTNPKGFADGGHITLFPEATEAVSELAQYHHDVAVILQALADQVASDAATAASGSGTEASAAEIRAGIVAKYMSIRNMYAAQVPVVLTDAATVAWDMSQGIDFVLTAAGLRTLANPTGQVIGKKGMLVVKQDTTGGRGFNAYGNNFIIIGGMPVFPLTPNFYTILSYWVIAANTVLLFNGGNQIA